MSVITIHDAFQSGDPNIWKSVLQGYEEDIIKFEDREVEFPENFWQYPLPLPLEFRRVTFINTAVNLLNPNVRLPKIVLIECIFQVPVRLKNLSVDLSGATFNAQLTLENCQNANFRATEFNSKTQFDSCQQLYLNKATFNKKAVFKGQFQKLEIRSAVFNRTVSFPNAKMPNGANFSKTIFKSFAAFTGTQFGGFTRFTACQFWKAPDFSGAALFEGTDFTLATLIDTKSDYAYSRYRTLKNKMNQMQESHEAHRFYALEQEALLNKIKWQTGNFWNTVLLLLNHWSNKHSQSWIRGVCFTLVVGIIFFILYLASMATYWYNPRPRDLIDWVSNILGQMKFFWPFLNPAHSQDFAFDQGTFISYSIDYIGRIFIGYGIYQTIQAFRKYGKR